MNTEQAKTIANLIQAAEQFVIDPADLVRWRRLMYSIAEARRLPNPDCPYCDGDGQRFEHTPGCKGDAGGCEMTGVAGDCSGVLVPCGCSVVDALEI